MCVGWSSAVAGQTGTHTPAPVVVGPPTILIDCLSVDSDDKPIAGGPSYRVIKRLEKPYSPPGALIQYRPVPKFYFVQDFPEERNVREVEISPPKMENEALLVFELGDRGEMVLLSSKSLSFVYANMGDIQSEGFQRLQCGPGPQY